MELFEAIFNRKSVRKYKAGEISDEMLKNCVKAGMAAPTAMNRQPWAFIIVRERAILDQLCDRLPYAKMLSQTPAAIIPCGDMKKAQDGADTGIWMQDLSAATQNIMLAAEAQGMGTVWTTTYPAKDRCQAVKEILALPDHIIPFAVIPIGIPSGEDQPKDKWQDENLHWDKW